ncbi:hypothetical protein J3U39_06275, partial [Gilliamella sp. B2779]
SEVKRRSADGSVGITHVRVGSRQTFKYIESPAGMLGFFAYRNYKLLKKFVCLSMPLNNNSFSV